MAAGTQQLSRDEGVHTEKSSITPSWKKREINITIRISVSSKLT